ncbi:MAG: cytochrome c biogenesis protein CcsA [Bacteroides sp.]|nr:cytochrome c biogenesis protein CcsA [Bacteroides sp.]
MKLKSVIAVCYVSIISLLAVATLAERGCGTPFVTAHIYQSPWFCCCWGTLALLSLGCMLRRRMWRRVPVVLAHGSLLFILAGAMTTHLWGRRGHVHLERGHPVRYYVEEESRKLCPLPFELLLDSFRIVCYAGTETPSDYVSRVTLLALPTAEETPAASRLLLQAAVSMNNVLDYQGYRFCQASYDDDGTGSWLTVNHDPWGTGITYAGYLLLGLSMLLLLLYRRGEFWRLLHHPLLKGGAVLLLMLLWNGGLEGQAARRLPVISSSLADSLARTQVVYNGRVAPFHTMATDLVKKLTGHPSFGALSAEEIVGSWMAYPEAWRNVPIIRIRSQALRDSLQLSSAYARLVDLFQDGDYRLRRFRHGGREGSGRPSSMEKAVLETDEKVALVGMLLGGTLFQTLSDDGTSAPLSELRLRAEILYNRLPFSRLLFMLNLSLGLLGLARLLFRLLRGGAGGDVRGVSLRMGWVGRGLAVALWLSCLFHLAGYLLRWYIAGRMPLSNGYETMQFMSLCALVMALLLYRRWPFLLPFGFLLSGFTLLVAHLGEMNPQVTPLMPVLVSPWLSTHVSFIMISYALFAFMMLNGLLAFCLPGEGERLMLLSRLMLYPATFFLGAGIFIGAVWANVSWGRYWAWDPKEVWALITFLVYAAAFHAGPFACFRRPRFFHGYVVAAFLAVLMTWFGVNCFLGGMHSYANG